MLFIPGFDSCGNGEKSVTLREDRGTEMLLAPDVYTYPAKAIETLEQILATQTVDLLIGSSLGGFCAVWLNRRHPRRAVLVISPCDPDSMAWHEPPPVHG
jgi:predicted esterase YcpF (UPF0227 family)